MKTHPYITLRAIFSIAALALAASTSIADTVFSFGPTTDYVTADANYTRSATRTGSGPYTYLNAFSDTQALSPASGYSGPVFYGGYTFTSSTIQGSSVQGVVLNNSSTIGGNDALRIYANISTGWATSTLSFASVYIFKQEDFAAPYKTGNFSLDGFSITYRASGAESAFVPTGRWLVQVGDNYYVSNTTITAAYNTTSTATLSGALLTSTQWAVYDPSVSLNFDQSVSFSALDLSKVTAVGIYFEQDSYTGTSASSAALLAISAYSVTGTVTAIPEPAHAMLWLALTGLGIVLSRQFFRR